MKLCAKCGEKPIKWAGGYVCAGCGCTEVVESKPSARKAGKKPSEGQASMLEVEV